MNQLRRDTDQPVFEIINAGGVAPIVLICEHASAFIPETYNNLGLSGDALNSHAAWDPGALGVAQGLSRHLDAVLIASRISRLVYDCNRPPGHPSAMPSRSEVFDIPGNMNVSETERSARHDMYYLPFRNAVASAVSAQKAPIIATIHSFTPIYHGQRRDVEIGILHDVDARVADAMLDCAKVHTQHIVRRNEPYGPVDGVTHTVAEHATPYGHPNVMIEVRNDLIATPAQQAEIARQMADWLLWATTEMTGGGA